MALSTIPTSLISSKVRRRFAVRHLISTLLSRLFPISPVSKLDSRDLADTIGYQRRIARNHRPFVVRRVQSGPAPGKPEPDETDIRRLVEGAGARFVGIQKSVEVLGEDLVLVTHRHLPHATIGLRFSQVDQLEVLLATSAQFCRYNRPVLHVVPKTLSKTLGGDSNGQ